MMKLWRQNHLRDSIRSERVKAVMDFGFSEPQARFLLHVLMFSGVFIERQYCACTGVTHGQRTKDFLAKLIYAFVRPGTEPPMTFGEKPVADITTGDIQAYRHHRRSQSRQVNWARSFAFPLYPFNV